MRKSLAVLASFMVLLVVCSAQSKRPLANDDVVKMVTMGFDEATIIKAIQANEPNFDTSVDSLMALKTAGVPKPIIDAMLEAEAKKKAPLPAVVPVSTATIAKETNPDVPDEVGVYIKLKGKLTEMESEVVNWRTGGVGKAMLSGGLSHGHVNGTVHNKESKLRVAGPLEFIIRCPEGTAATEYQLLRLDEHGDRREFRAITGGVIHASGGAERNAVGFEPEKIASRTYRIKLAELKKGEYGFLPPGAMSMSVASAGKMYTFSVIE